MKLLPVDLRLLWLITVLSACSGLSGCIQGNSLATTQQNFNQASDVSSQTLSIINRQLRQSIHAGGWYLKGTEVSSEGVRAYIKIPAQLDLDRKYQENYLRQSLCRMITDRDVWRELEDVTLTIHIYTHSKKQSVHARCNNPLA